MSYRPLVRLLVALLVAGVVWFTRQNGAVQANPGPAPSVSPVSTVGFRDAQHLHEHFRKHGREFGNVTEAEYLRLAQGLRDRTAGDLVLESVRADGVVTRFDRSSGAFLAYDRDGTIRTFFRPNDGERYYTRQLARGQSER